MLCNLVTAKQQTIDPRGRQPPRSPAPSSRASIQRWETGFEACPRTMG